MSDTVFGNAVGFMNDLGLFDTILPFLLVFTLVFAFLEKTKIFGLEDYRTEGGDVVKVTRKNLNSMVAFVIGFFVVGSTQLVAQISEITAQIVLVLVLVFSFLLTVGAFSKEKDESFALEGTWAIVFQIIAFLAIALIFLNTLGWIDIILDFLTSSWDSQLVASLIMIAVLVGFIFFITYEKSPDKDKGKGKKD
ncbi:MAG: hypothetical protein ACMXX6_00005 [Candidatus Woesearchaeota archaeon]